MPVDAVSIIKRNASLKDQRATNDTEVQQINELFLPRRSDVQVEKTPSVDGWTDRIYDTTAARSAQMSAAGQYDLLFSGKWFETSAPMEGMDEETEAWYKEVGPKMMARMANSNFPLEIQEFILDRTVAATALIHIDEDEEDGFRFIFTPYGQYSIAENHKKLVDTVFREFKMSARQIVGQFGEEAAGVKVMKALEDKNGAKADDPCFTIIHAIYKRSPKEVKMGVATGDKMPWASVYVCVDDKMVLREGGYQEQPFAVSRFHRWGNTPYGYGPAWLELPTARQLQFIEKSLDAQSDSAVNPGIIVSDDQEDEIDRYGITTVSMESAAAGLPKFWPSQSRYDIGKDRLEDKIRRIEDSFMVTMFRLLTSEREQNREKTAFEVSKMLEEQVSMSSPTFYRFLTETLPVVLNRVFAVMLRRGELGEPPEGALVQKVDGSLSLETPAIVFTSKLAQAIKAVETNTLLLWLNAMGQLKAVFPEVPVDDNFDFDYAVRTFTEHAGLWPKVVKPMSAVNETRQRNQQIQEAAMALQGGEQLSQISKNMK